MVWLGATDALRHRLRAGQRGVLAHVVGARLDPDRVVDDPVHDRVRMNTGAEALVPVLLRVLGAEHRRRFAVTALHQLQQHAAHRLCRPVQQPLVNNEQRERGVFAEELPGPAGGVLSGDPGFFEVGHTDVVGADAVLAGAFGDRASQIRLPWPGEPLEDDVLLPGHE